MAVAKKQTREPIWQVSWKKLFIALSVTANIGFVVAITAMMTSHVLDGMFMHEGLNRYCAVENNEKFSDASEKVRALRGYTCASGDAKPYFEEGFSKYLDYKGIAH